MREKTRSGPVQHPPDRGLSFLDGLLQQGDRGCNVAIVLHGCFNIKSSFGDPESADGPRRPLQRMRQCGGVGRDGFEAGDELPALGLEKRENFGFERGLAERHAPEMLDVDGGVFRNERWRRHPVQPLKIE